MANRISKSFTEFDSSMPLQVNYLLEHGDRFLLSGANRNQLRDLYSAWTANFFQFQEPEFRTALRRRELATIKKELLKLIAVIRKFLRVNPLIELTAEDRIALVIPTYKVRREVLPLPTETPVNLIVYNYTGKIIVQTRKLGYDPQSRYDRMPKRYRLRRYIAYTDSPQIKPTMNDFQYMSATGRMRYTLDLTAHRGKTAWLYSKFSNSSGAGPTSEITSFLIV